MIRYTAMARNAIEPQDAYEVGVRAMELAATVGVIWNSKHRWCAGARTEAVQGPTVRGFGKVREAIDCALDRLEDEIRDRASDRYSPDELVGIYNATGGEVQRA